MFSISSFRRIKRVVHSFSRHLYLSLYCVFLPLSLQQLKKKVCFSTFKHYIVSVFFFCFDKFYCRFPRLLFLSVVCSHFCWDLFLTMIKLLNIQKNVQVVAIFPHLFPSLGWGALNSSILKKKLII